MWKKSIQSVSEQVRYTQEKEPAEHIVEELGKEEYSRRVTEAFWRNKLF